MNYKKPFHLLVCFVLGVILLAACGGPSPKSGEVRGALVSQTGQPLSAQMTIILCRMNENSDKCKLDADYQVTTADGTFSINFVPVGDYTVYVISSSGQGAFLKQNDGKTLIIRLEEKKDFDLGKIYLSVDGTQQP